MGRQTLSDEELLASHELGSFAVFYGHSRGDPRSGVVVANADGTLTRIDASNGRVRWTARPAEGSAGEVGSGRTEGTVAIAGATVWALAQDSRRASERLTAVDVETGRTLTATTLKDFGAGWLTPVGDVLWYIAPQGYAVVVRP